MRLWSKVLEASVREKLGEFLRFVVALYLAFHFALGSFFGFSGVFAAHSRLGAYASLQDLSFFSPLTLSVQALREMTWSGGIAGKALLSLLGAYFLVVGVYLLLSFWTRFASLRKTGIAFGLCILPVLVLFLLVMALLEGSFRGTFWPFLHGGFMGVCLLYLYPKQLIALDPGAVPEDILPEEDVPSKLDL